MNKESEVKNIEWLKGRLGGRKVFKPQNDREIGYNVAIDEFSEYVDQLDQLDNREQLEIAYKDILERGEFWFDDKRYVVVEKKTVEEEWVMEWLDNNDFYDHRTAETVLANAVDKGELGYYGTKYAVVEKPVIPQFVADILEENTFADLPTALEELFSANAGHYYGEDVCKWIVSNEETFARAWLDGYEAEEEPLYRARLKVITDEFIASYLCTQSSDAEDRLKALEIGSKYIHEDYRHLSEFTEDELKKLNIWDSEQWEVEEVEE